MSRGTRAALAAQQNRIQDQDNVIGELREALRLQQVESQLNVQEEQKILNQLLDRQGALNAKIEEQGITIQEQGIAMRDQVRTVREQDERIREQDEKNREQGITIQEQGIAMRDQVRTVREQDEKIRGLERSLTCNPELMKAYRDFQEADNKWRIEVRKAAENDPRYMKKLAKITKKAKYAKKATKGGEQAAGHGFN